MNRQHQSTADNNTTINGNELGPDRERPNDNYSDYCVYNPEYYDDDADYFLQEEEEMLDFIVDMQIKDEINIIDGHILQINFKNHIKKLNNNIIGNEKELDICIDIINEFKTREGVLMSKLSRSNNGLRLLMREEEIKQRQANNLLKNNNEEIEGNIMGNMVLSQKDETKILEIADDISVLLSEDKDDECLLSTKFDNEELDGAETPNDEKFNITITCDIINEEMGAETPRPNEENNITIKCDINDEIGIAPECDINNGINAPSLISYKIDELAIDELAIDEIGIAPECGINNDEQAVVKLIDEAASKAEETVAELTDKRVSEDEIEMKPDGSQHASEDEEKELKIADDKFVLLSEESGSLSVDIIGIKIDNKTKIKINGNSKQKCIKMNDKWVSLSKLKCKNNEIRKILDIYCINNDIDIYSYNKMVVNVCSILVKECNIANECDINNEENRNIIREFAISINSVPYDDLNKLQEGVSRVDGSQNTCVEHELINIDDVLNIKQWNAFKDAFRDSNQNVLFSLISESEIKNNTNQNKKIDIFIYKKMILLCFIAYSIDQSDIKDPTNLYLGIIFAVVVILTVVNGKDRGVVTGDETFMERTAQLATSTEGEETPIAKEIKDFVSKVLIAFVLGITFFIIDMVENDNLVANVVFLIGIIISNVPEGLLATVTVSVTLTARRMFDKNVRVKNLESIDTLGLTSVICSDKTGTLTTNVMTCQHVYYDLKECECDTDNPLAAVKVRCGALCNNAEFIDGDIVPTTNATKAAGHILGEYREKHNKLNEIPFNSKNEWQVSVHELPNDMLLENEKTEKKSNDKRAIIQMKTAPERILKLCDRYLFEDEIIDLHDEIRRTILDSVRSLGSRVLALAELILNSSIYDINIMEPVIEQKYIVEIDESCKNEDSVIIMYNDEKIKITINAKDEDTGKKILFEDLYMSHLMEGIELELHNMPIATQIIGFSDFAANSFKKIGIKRGSLIHLMKGPYKFNGTKAEEVNWPFRRNDSEEGLVFISLYAMIDPPRPGAPEAVGRCQSAGIKVIMVTGDHPVTAKAMAQKVGIIVPRSQTKEQVAEYNGNIDQVNENEYDAIVIPGHLLQENLDTEAEDPPIITINQNLQQIQIDKKMDALLNRNASENKFDELLEFIDIDKQLRIENEIKKIKEDSPLQIFGGEVILKGSTDITNGMQINGTSDNIDMLVIMMVISLIGKGNEYVINNNNGINIMLFNDTIIAMKEYVIRNNGINKGINKKITEFIIMNNINISISNPGKIIINGQNNNYNRRIKYDCCICVCLREMLFCVLFLLLTLNTGLCVLIFTLRGEIINTEILLLLIYLYLCQFVLETTKVELEEEFDNNKTYAEEANLKDVCSCSKFHGSIVDDSLVIAVSDDKLVHQSVPSINVLSEYELSTKSNNVSVIHRYLFNMMLDVQFDDEENKENKSGDRTEDRYISIITIIFNGFESSKKCIVEKSYIYVYLLCSNVYCIFDENEGNILYNNNNDNKRLLICTDNSELLIFDATEFSGVLDTGYGDTGYGLSKFSILTYSKGLIIQCDNGTILAYECNVTYECNGNNTKNDVKEICKHINKLFIGNNNELIGITNWCIPPQSEEQLACIMLNNQIYSINLLQIEVISLHHKDINEIDICTRKLYLVTCGLVSRLLLSTSFYHKGCTSEQLTSIYWYFYGNKLDKQIYSADQLIDPLGWNIRVCVQQLYEFIDMFKEIPVKVIHFLIYDINYGGKVTYNTDRRTSKIILDDFIFIDDELKVNRLDIRNINKVVNHINDNIISHQNNLLI